MRQWIKEKNKSKNQKFECKKELFYFYFSKIFRNRLNIMDGLHVVLITLIDDVFKSFKLILACLSGTYFKKSEYTTRISIFTTIEKSPCGG